MSIFGERLITARKAVGYTQYTLSEKTGLPRSTLSGYESMGKEAPYEVLVRLASTLGVSTDYLTGKTSERITPQESVVMADLGELNRIYRALSSDKRATVTGMLGDVYAAITALVRDGNDDAMAACGDLFAAARKMVEKK